MPLPAVLGALALMGAVVAWGFAGPPGRRRRPVLTIACLAAGLASFPAGVVARLEHHPVAGMAALAAGVCLLAVAAHLLRTPDADPVPRADAPAPPPDPREPDWDAFDRARAAWGRPPRSPQVREPDRARAPGSTR